MSNDREYARAALNCDFDPTATDRSKLCPRCGSPFRLHALPAMTLLTLGYVHGDHPAWRAALGLPAADAPHKERWT